MPPAGRRVQALTQRRPRALKSHAEYGSLEGFAPSPPIPTHWKLLTLRAIARGCRTQSVKHPRGTASAERNCIKNDFDTIGGKNYN